MKNFLPALKSAALMGTVAAALVAFASTGHSQNLYNAATTTANPQTGAVHFLQIVNPAQGAGNYSLTQISFGVNFNLGTNPNSTGYGVLFYFYTGVNTSPTATDALATATYVNGVSGTITAPGASGNFTYTFTLATPITVSTPDGSFGVEFSLTNSAFTAYNTDTNGRFTASAPTVGTSPGYVWNDANLDNTFAGSEQTKFSQTNANVRFGLTGTVPEPGTWATVAIGGLGLLVVVRRRRVA